MDGVRLPNHITRERVQNGKVVHFIPEQLDTDRKFFIHRNDLNRVPANPECSTRESHIVARVLHSHK